MITIMANIPESMDKITFHEDINGNPIPFYDGEFFTGTIIDHRGELTFDNGDLVGVVVYDQRVLH